MHPALTKQPLKPTTRIAKVELEKFKHYLENQASELSKIPDLLPYLAFAVVKDPQTNPSFSKLFTKEWTEDLRESLVSYLAKLSPAGTEPCLVTIYKRWVNSQSKENQKPKLTKQPSNQGNAAGDNIPTSEMMDYIRELENNNRELLDLVQGYHDKTSSLEEEVHMLKAGHSVTGKDDEATVEVQKKWATFSKEILKLAKTIYQSSGQEKQAGQQAQEYKKKLTEFDDFLSLNMDHLMMDRQTPTVKTRPLPEASKLQESFFPVDYGKIKGYLLSKLPDSDEIVLTLTKSLKKRLMRGDPTSRRQNTVLYVYADLFNLKSTKPVEERVFYKLLTHLNTDIKGEALKVLNLMCWLSVARKHMGGCKEFLELLIHILKTEGADSKIRRRSLSILQSVSLLKKPQDTMIENETIESCIQILNEEQDTLCAHSLDYFTALLMNLCLRIEGRERCAKYPIDIFELMENLLHFESSQVRTFVNGILFSLISHPELKKRAKETGFLKRLEVLKTRLEERFCQQINCIIEEAERPEKAPVEDFEDEGNLEDLTPVDEEDISDGRLLLK
jgi:hypothetical protein